MREIVTKGWGEEEIWVSNQHYASKFLRFKQGGTSSMHFHKEKHEHWLVLSGKFEVTFILLTDGSRWSETLENGSVMEIPPILPHQVHCYEEGVILEVSTHDDPKDNYRIEPGDSQQ